MVRETGTFRPLEQGEIGREVLARLNRVADAVEKWTVGKTRLPNRLRIDMGEEGAEELRSVRRWGGEAFLPKVDFNALEGDEEERLGYLWEGADVISLPGGNFGRGHFGLLLIPIVRDTRLGTTIMRADPVSGFDVTVFCRNGGDLVRRVSAYEKDYWQNYIKLVKDEDGKLCFVPVTGKVADFVVLPIGGANGRPVIWTGSLARGSTRGYHPWEAAEVRYIREYRDSVISQAACFECQIGQKQLTGLPVRVLRLQPARAAA